MADAKFILYIRKFLKNPLLARKQVGIELVHSELANVSKAQIAANLAKMFKAKEEAISVIGLHTKFGGGRSSGMALIYDNLDAKKKYDSKMRLHNEKLVLKKAAANRKQKKDIRTKKSKLRGIKKAAVTFGKKKK